MQLNHDTLCNQQQKLLTVTTHNVAHTLSLKETDEAFRQLFEKMKVFDPNNPNLWVVQLNGHKLWGILDEGAGPNRENVLTLLFPEDY